MPPKKANAPSKKTQEKARAKAVEDKTFGLKNKKGAKQQKYIETVNKQMNNQRNQQNKGGSNEPKLSKKQQRELYLQQLDDIMKPVEKERKVMISKKQAEKDKDKEVVYLTIEELVEVERVKLKNSGKKLTPVTLES